MNEYFKRYTPPALGETRQVRTYVYRGQEFSLSSDIPGYGSKGDTLTLTRSGTMERLEVYKKPYGWAFESWVITTYEPDPPTAWERLIDWLTTPLEPDPRPQLPEAKIHER